jgi:hypothetical protein
MAVCAVSKRERREERGERREHLREGQGERKGREERRERKTKNRRKGESGIAPALLLFEAEGDARLCADWSNGDAGDCRVVGVHTLVSGLFCLSYRVV